MSVQPIHLGSIGEATSSNLDMCCGGGSCAVPSDTVERAADGATAVREVKVSGMTCAHCVDAVTDELSALDGVDEVSVDLVAGGESRVTFRAPAALDDAAVSAAVEEAGYHLV